ncbi:MAG: hypothetical protein WDM77_19260 [Steroidobacteraceae bacterium]
MDLHLQKNAAGKGNWQDFGNEKSAPTDNSANAGGQASIFQSLAGIEVTNSRVTYDSMSIAAVKLEVGNVSQKASVPVSVSFQLDRGPDAATASVAATMRYPLMWRRTSTAWWTSI